MNLDGLLEYQRPAPPVLLDALRLHGAAFDASDMGVGKTAHACAVIRELDVPTLCVVPAVSVADWQWMAKHFGIDPDVQSLDLLRLGNTPFGQWDNPPPRILPTFYQCTGCQCEVDPTKPFPCPHHPGGIHCVKILKREHKYGRFNWHPGIKLLVVDEVHKCGGLDSLQADMLIAAKRQRIPTLGLSATGCDSPLGMRALGFLLGLHELIGPRGFYPWAMSRGCKKLPFRGFHYVPAEGEDEKIIRGLHQDIFPSRGARVKISDLGDRFPKCTIRAQLYNITDPARMDALYREMAELIAIIHDAREKGGDTALERLLRARQELEMLKLPVFEQRTKDLIAAGRSVANFLNFRASVKELARRLGTSCMIIGGQTEHERRTNIDAFGADSERAIVVSAAAGGVSVNLQDRHGNFPRSGEVNLGHSARETRQIFGRLPRSGGKSPVQYDIILCAGTIEEPMRDALAGKLDRYDLLNDGDISPLGNLPLTISTNDETLI